jgi:hypothetical protein
MPGVEERPQQRCGLLPVEKKGSPCRAWPKTLSAALVGKANAALGLPSTDATLKGEAATREDVTWLTMS